MRKKFLVNISFLIFLNLLIKPFWIFGIDRSVQNLVGSSEYGLYFALLNFTFLFSFLLDFGLTNYNNHSVSKNEGFIEKNFSKIAAIKLLLAIAYLLITIISGLILGYSNHILLLAVLTINQFLLSFILFLRSNISGLQIFWLDSIISILDRVVVIGICAILIWGGITEQPFRVEWLAYSQTVAYVLTLIICIAVLVLRSGSLITIPHNSFIWSTLKLSLPYSLIILFMTLYFRVDAVMLEQIIDDNGYQAGIYAQSYRFLDMINNFMFLLIGILFPMLSKQFAKGSEIRQLIAFSTAIMIIPSILIIGIALNYNQELIKLSYTDFSSISGMVLRVLLLSYIPLVFSQVYGTVLTASGHLKAMILWSGMAFILNILLNGLLIPSYGPLGAAWASIGSQIVMAIGCTITAFRLVQFRISIKELGQFVILSLVIAGSCLMTASLNFVWGVFTLLSVTSVILLLYLISQVKQFNQFKPWSN